MKKIILILLFSASTIFAYSVISKSYDGSDINYLINCNNGKSVAFSKRIEDGAYFIYNNIVYSMDKAVQIGCKKTKINTNTYITIKKGSLIFDKRLGHKSITYYLENETAYAGAELDAAIGGGNVHKINRNFKVKKLGYYNKNDSIIDGYYKITDDTNKIYYVRKSDIR